MNDYLITLYREHGSPFPAGGRVAALCDMEAAGMMGFASPSRTYAEMMDERRHNQPSNRGLDRIGAFYAPRTSR